MPGKKIDYAGTKEREPAILGRLYTIKRCCYYFPEANRACLDHDDLVSEATVRLISDVDVGTVNENTKKGAVVRMALNAMSYASRCERSNHGLPIEYIDHKISKPIRKDVASTEAALNEFAKALPDALSSIPEAQEEAIRLRFYSGMSYQQVADTLGIKKILAYKRIGLGLTKLKRILRSFETLALE